MRFLRYLALLAVLIVPAATYSHAQVSVGVGIGGPVYGGYGYPCSGLRLRLLWLCSLRLRALRILRPVVV